MNGVKPLAICVLIVSACASLAGGQVPESGPRVDPAIQVRNGFSLSMALADIKGARFMAFAPDGTLFVSQPDRGQISACRDENGDGSYEKTAVFVKNHPTVHGLFWYAGWQSPREYRGDAFVAYHGSWNREKKAGYCVTRVLFDQGRPYGELVYVRFLTKEERVLGRPVDVVVAPDGSLLISDDEAGRIYRLSYRGRPSGDPQ